MCSPGLFLKGSAMSGTVLYETEKKTSRRALQEQPRRRRLGSWYEKRIAPYVFVLPFFVLFAIFGVYPLLYALNLSFTSLNGNGAQHYVGLSNYAFLLTDGLFWSSLGNSLYLWLFIVPVQTILAVLVASLLSSPRLRLRWFFRTVFLTPYVVPVVAAALVWQILFDQDYGAANTVLKWLHLTPIGWLTTVAWAKPTLGLLVLWKSSGFAVIIMLAAIQSVPQEYYEAAAIDGAGKIQRFWYITLPLLRRAISFFVVISTLGVIQMFLEPFVLTGGAPDNSTITAGYRLWLLIQQANLGTGAANSFLLMILVVIIALVMVRLMTGREER
jgi:ABC-type sugar transport system permease subunit